MSPAERRRIHWMARILGRLHRLAKIRLITQREHVRLSRCVVAEYTED